MQAITIGQYVKSNSWLHKVDPRLKIFLSFALMIMIFFIPSLLGMLIVFGCFLVLLLSTRVSIFKIFHGVKPVLFLVLFTSVLQMNAIKTGDLLFTLDFSLSWASLLVVISLVLFYFFTSRFIKFKTTYFFLTLFLVFYLQTINYNVSSFYNYQFSCYTDGFYKSSYIFLRIILMISISTLLTVTTSNIEIHNGISSLLKPLTYLKINVELFSMMFSLVLRFIPFLYLEIEKIEKAQSSRGALLNKGSLFKRIKNMISLFIPIIVIAFSKANDLAYAMEARGYTIKGKRTRYDILKFKFRDYIILSLFIISIPLLIWWNLSV